MSTGSPARFEISSPVRNAETATPAVLGILRDDLIRLARGVEEVHAEVGRLRGDCAASVSASNQTMEQLKDVVEWKAVQQEQNLQDTIIAARQEFDGQRAALEKLSNDARVTFEQQH